MKRITEKDLDCLVKSINKATNSPISAYSKTIGGRLVGRIGNYHLDYACDGVKLVRMVNEDGGITVVSDGYDTKRELYNWMRAFLAGMSAKD